MLSYLVLGVALRALAEVDEEFYAELDCDTEGGVVFLCLALSCLVLSRVVLCCVGVYVSTCLVSSRLALSSVVWPCLALC